MKTGFSRLCITPPLGTAISGYYEDRNVKGVLDDLYVHVIAFDDGEKKAAIVSLDLLMISSKKCDEYRKAISEKSGIDMSSLFVSCTHTHTGPLTEKDFASGKENDKDYEHFMITQMCDAVCYALRDLAESKFSFALGKAENISFIRRYRMKNGNVQTNPGVGNPDIDHALGTPNETVKLLKIERENADDIYIVNFGTHSDTVGGEYISADYPGFVRSTVEKALDNVKCVFLTGAQGNVNHVKTNPTIGDRQGMFDDFDGVPRGYDHAKHMGRVIAGAVLQICGKTTPLSADRLNIAETVITIPANSDNDRYEEALRIVKLHEEGRDNELPYEKMELTTVVAEANRICVLKDGPESFSFTLTCMSLGDVALAGLPGEPFVEIGLDIEKASPFAETFVCCLTNGGDSYFPASSAYDEGGYEARTSQLRKGGDKIIVDGMKKVLTELKNK